MIEQISNAIKFIAYYIASKQGKTGLTVTCDVYKNGSIIVTGASCTEIGGGLYSYTLASGSVDAEGEYLAVFKTADSTVDQQWIPAMWLIQKAGVERLDEAVSAAKTLTAAYDAAKNAASQSSVNSLPASVWAALTSGLTTVGSIGKLLVDMVDAAISTRLASASYTAPDNSGIAAIKAKTDNLPADPASNTQVNTRLASASYSAPPSTSSIASAVWSALTSGLTTVGSIGKFLIDNLSNGLTATVAISQAQAQNVASGSLAIGAYSTFAQSIDTTHSQELSSATKLWLAVKANSNHSDDQAIILIEKTAGITRLLGENYASTTDGSIDVSGVSGDWSIDITMSANATSLLTGYDKTILGEAKAIVAGKEIVLWSGPVAITTGLVRAHS